MNRRSDECLLCGDGLTGSGFYFELEYRPHNDADPGATGGQICDLCADGIATNHLCDTAVSQTAALPAAESPRTRSSDASRRHHLQAALDAARNPQVRYHLRAALQYSVEGAEV